jgi:ABC-2 type transport system ATP-binding protein
VIEMTELTKSYGPQRAVDGLTVRIRPGRVTGFLGPNGAGKSTTMRLILGLDHPDRGVALVGGEQYRELRDPLRAVGAHLDGRSAHPGRTARAHLVGLARYHRIPVARVATVCEIAGIARVARMRVGQFSLGMTQRLGIATALLGDPEVLMLDEPFNGLDIDGVRWVRSMLRRLADEGRTVFVSSHLLAEMQHTADHVVVLGRGRLLADCPTSELVGAASLTVLVEVPDRSDRSRLERVLRSKQLVVASDGSMLRVATGDIGVVGDLAHAEGVRLHELTRESQTLEDGYLRLVEGEQDFRAVTS